MARFFRKRDEAIGLAPGTLVFIGDKKVEGMQVRLIDYNPDALNDKQLEDVMDGVKALDRNTVSWLNINGLHETEMIQRLGEGLNLHPLLLADIINTGQRPKLDEFDNVIFVVLKMLQLDGDKIVAEQLSVVIGPTFVLTFQERPGDVFEPVRNRIRNSLGRIRVAGPDYLAYALLDTVVDNYIQIIERFGGLVEDLEVDVLGDPESSTLARIHALKREVSFLRKSIRPAREAILKLSKLDNALISPTTAPFLKDLSDISIQAGEAIDTYREMLSDALNIYNSTVSNKMNDIMKVLTIFAAVFIPLTFIAGVYGTNFENLPELHYKYSYHIFLGVLAAVAIGMLAFFRKKRWL